MDRYTEFKFSSTYHLAGDIRQAVFENAPEDYFFDYFSLDDNLHQQLLVPQKLTILHDFIKGKYNEVVEFLSDKADHSDVVEDWQKLLTVYKVPFKIQNEFAKDEAYADDEVE